MKNILFTGLLLFSFITNNAADTDSTISYNLPDTLKAIQFLAEIKIDAVNTKKEVAAGIKTDLVSLSIESDKKEKEITFTFPESSKVMATGLRVETEEDELEWKYDWKTGVTYKLLISIAQDSAGNFVLYSGYMWLPIETKWKLIGTCKIEGQWESIKKPALFYSTGLRKKEPVLKIQAGEVWVQRRNGSWKNLQDENIKTPMVNVTSHVDSIVQQEEELAIIREAIAAGKTDAINEHQGIYFVLLKEGTGRQVVVTDTVVIHYKGSLFSDGSVFDQTKDKPATFPLSRLIKGWQIGLPLCKVGSKIKIVIPSAHAYSIRTRASKIPPNSILVFEIEVFDTKPVQ
ncbi:MAG: FKBP-type peptidyl-prolyl cis-trans isomerase [Chitinophagaceae bacterium]|nr:FKBP-type peptidyl-prolyl cis-trans isomerase [Chitinophagaceae bacterium]